MVWHIDGQPSEETFDTEGEALARAWQITPAGGSRPAVRQVLVAKAPGSVSMKIGDDWVPVGEISDAGLVGSTGAGRPWLDVSRPTSIRGSEGGLVMEVHALAYKEHIPDFLRRNESALAAVVWERMDRKIREFFGPDTARATIVPEDNGWVSHSLDKVVDSGAVTYRRRFKVVYDDE